MVVLPVDSRKRRYTEVNLAIHFDDPVRGEAPYRDRYDEQEKFGR